MEGQGRTPELQSAEEIESAHFLQLGQKYQGCMTPLCDLPHEYRREIDRGFSTGWRGVDTYIQGLRRGEVTVVTADTGAGKTTFCTQLIVNCSMQGIPCWINSWEMKPETTMRKLASIVLHRPMKICPFTDIESEQFDRWASHYKIFINQTTMGTDINSLAEQLTIAKRLGVEVVMLDHLDYLVNMKREKVHEAIDETVKRLHELAFGLNMHFLLICHPRQSATNVEEIGMHSLKGSSSIKQYADNILVLHRSARTDPRADPNQLKVRIAKNRMFGIEGNTYLFYQPLWDGYGEYKQGVTS
jgi:twinkle protein